MGRLSESYLNDTPFDGSTIAPQDVPRLSKQMAGVKSAMSGGAWRTLGDLQTLVGGSEAGISARIRDLRKERFGSHLIERRRLNGGLWQYRMIV